MNKNRYRKYDSNSEYSVGHLIVPIVIVLFLIVLGLNEIIWEKKMEEIMIILGLISFLLAIFFALKLHKKETRKNAFDNVKITIWWLFVLVMIIWIIALCIWLFWVVGWWIIWVLAVVILLKILKVF